MFRNRVKRAGHAKPEGGLWTGGVFSPACDVGQSQRDNTTVASIPASWATMNAAAADGSIPAKVSEIDRAIVTAGGTCRNLGYDR
jgi:hypothetical protein